MRDGAGLVLGLSGFLDVPSGALFPDLPRGLYHDAAACLVDGSGVLAAVEEERFNREKHTNQFPVAAIRSCLDEVGARLSDVEAIGYFFTEANTDYELGLQYLRHPDGPVRRARELIGQHMHREFGSQVDPQRIRFAAHHEAHAASTFFQSGMADALVLVMDGEGDDESVSVYRGTADGLHPLRRHPKESSLGHFYGATTELLGYDLFDEYKVMGLAPYGDPARFRATVDPLLRLLPDGDFHLDVAGFRRAVLGGGYRLRTRGSAFTQEQMDLAATAQETLERIVVHLLEFWRGRSGLTGLCLAGGVAHNSSLNGRILASGLFDRMFVHPASHDAGAAVGAALLCHPSVGTKATRPSGWTLRHVYWGPGVGDPPAIQAELRRWHRFLDWRRCDSPAESAAELVARGEVIGWVQGRSEFGPRALGNRSIVADPRPAENWRRVNRLVKGREDYRPLAPAVPREVAPDWFDVPTTACPLDYMSCVVSVRPSRRDLLGAVTHVDGTARIQTVDRATNPMFWALISRFGELTGVPVLLNTSFNNNAEPIVQSARDAIVCLLTTGLEHAVIGDFLVSRRPAHGLPYGELLLRLPDSVELAEVHAGTERRQVVRRRRHRGSETAVSPVVYDLLARSDGRVSIADLLGNAPDACHAMEVVRGLWARRLVVLQPPD